MTITNEQSFEAIICGYYPRVVGYVSLIHSRIDAEDIAQDVFATLWEKRHSLEFPDEDHLAAWILKCAKTKSIDRLRRKKTSSVVSSLNSLSEYELDYLMENGDEFFEKLGRKDLFEKVLSLSDELPEVRRNVFRLSYVNNLPSRDISKLMDMPMRTVENHLYQALKYLRSKAGPMEFIFLFIILKYLP